MRIQLITHAFGPEVSPPQRRWTSFVDSFLTQGIDVDVVAPSPSNGSSWNPYTDSERLKHSGSFRLYRFNFHGKGDRWYTKLIVHFCMIIFMLPRALRTEKPDLLIVTVPALPNLVAGHLLSKIRRVPLVVEMRDAWPEILSESRVIPIRVLENIAVKAIRRMQHSASLVIAVTNGQAERLRKDGARNVRVVSNGYRFRELERKKQHKVKCERRLRAVYLGNLGESQGLSKLLDVAAISQEWLDLRIIGQGSAQQRLKEKAVELGLENVLQGSIRGSEVLDVYDWADTGFVCLRDDWNSFHYTVPSKLFELAGFGCHITGLVLGEASELIHKFSLGHTFDGDAMSISQDLRSKLLDIKSWAPSPSNQTAFIEKFDHESLGFRYAFILMTHLNLLDTSSVS